MSALRPVLARPRRPPVLDAARTALIPLRPLTITRDDINQAYAAAAAEADRLRRAGTVRTLRNLGLTVVQAPPGTFAPGACRSLPVAEKAGQL